MSSLLSANLEQIALCATAIGELPFAGPKRFTNALLGQHDITSLIRDTEAHEQALFHLAPPQFTTNGQASELVPATIVPPPVTASSRRATVYAQRPPRNRAVAAVLGGELYQKTRIESTTSRQKGELDVEVLLEGAERLTAVYPTPGVSDRIAQLRRRYQQSSATIAHYEGKVNQQNRDLERLNTQNAGNGDDWDLDYENQQTITSLGFSKEDVERAEAEIRELEAKKKSLEERVTGMERDLGGLMR